MMERKVRKGVFLEEKFHFIWREIKNGKVLRTIF